MPIQVSPAPQAALDAIRQAIEGSRGRFSAARHDPSATRRGALFLCVPHRMAELPADKISADAKLGEVAAPGDWRYLVVQKRTDDAAAEKTEGYTPIAIATATSVGGGQYRFGMWSEGSLATRTAAAIRVAEADNRVSEGDYEPLVLVVPALHVKALWLKDRTGTGRDLVSFIPRSVAEPAPERPMTANEFLSKLQDIARKLPPGGRHP
jgi:hypothetical protein